MFHITSTNSVLTQRLTSSANTFTNPKMQLAVLVALAVVGATAAPAPQQQAQILRYENNNDGLNSYNFLLEQSDGQKRQEQGELKNAGTDNEFIVVRGSYEWVGPDGVTYLISYEADENGFRPNIQQGAGGAIPSGVVASLLG